ncbi:putative zinc-binding protein [Blautia hydrogenotrophica]|uniref:putative zinc-binding protein n=1 Tax=Blautia hydrogenotrophica TaxID=53443 RepID=UPI0006C15F80|nr:putative zinc-binding protein [Blautia hydrogenotrophica]MEE0463162.1 putative zinc-binding protein [Blautia hydrogenotrophica]CUM71800.1 DGC domain [Blautia hydrogenotrophica]SCI14292.1 DGC domain [uncultured Blautia sp.]
MSEIPVGVLSCSGEEYLGGTLARMATRKVMEELRPGKVVTLCLPLYIAGGEEERRFAEEYPVIAVDGCKEGCAKCATEKYSGQVKDQLIIAELIGETTALSKTVSMKKLTKEHEKMACRIAEEICKKVDRILEEYQ